MKIKLDIDALRFITLFESLTGTKVRDFLCADDKLIFIVENGHIQRAIGKHGENIRRVREILKKNVDVIEYSINVETFIRNIFHDYTVKEVGIDKNMVIVTVDMGEKARAIGKDGKNLKLARTILQRHHNIENLIIH